MLDERSHGLQIGLQFLPLPLRAPRFEPSAPRWRCRPSPVPGVLAIVVPLPAFCARVWPGPQPFLASWRSAEVRRGSQRTRRRESLGTGPRHVRTRSERFRALNISTSFSKRKRVVSSIGEGGIASAAKLARSAPGSNRRMSSMAALSWSRANERSTSSAGRRLWRYQSRAAATQVETRRLAASRTSSVVSPDASDATAPTPPPTEPGTGVGSLLSRYGGPLPLWLLWARGIDGCIQVSLSMS